MATIPSSMPSSWDPAAIPDEEWPAEVAFLPFVGERYKDGWNGHRVLLLGESHYRREGMTDQSEDTRLFTKKEFSPMAHPERTERWGGFWDALDRVLIGKKDYTPSEAAEAWDRIAYINQCQVFAGTESFHRPSAKAMAAGGDILHGHVLAILKPTVVLVLGRFTWQTLRHGMHMPQFDPYIAGGAHRNGSSRFQKERSIWRLDYEGGAAWMTWVYHPSWHIDTWEDRAGALRRLLKLKPIDRIKEEA